MDAGTTNTIINLATPVNAGDAANKGYVDTGLATKLSLAGGTMSGAIAMGTSKITGVGDPTSAQDAATKTYVDTADALKLALAGGTMSGAIAMNTNRITGLGDPSAAQDAATKNYVDSVAQGLDVKGSVRAATTATISLSGTQTIDTVVLSTGDRVLVKDQSTPSQNGIYVVAAGAWSRATDADTWVELTGAFTFVESGSVNDNTGWVCTIAPGGTLGSTAVTWEQFSGAGQITAGAGLTKTGNTLDVGTASATRIVVNSDNIDLATTGVTANTYKSVTVDTYGRVTAGTNPTTLAGYGISDAYTSSATDTLLSAKLNLAGGTMSGAIAMGTNKITGLGNPTSAQDAATKTYVDTADALKLALAGGTMSGAIAMGANKITGMADPTNAQDATTKYYVDSILGSATSAATSAAAAAVSETNAGNSATAAAGSASAAAGSASAAAASYDAFDDRYLGSKSADPTVDNDGNALLTGALYWNTTASIMKVYDGSSWTAAYIPTAGYVQKSGDTMTGNLTVPGFTISSLTGYVYANGSGTVSASTTIPNAGLANSAVTIGSTSVSLGATASTLAGLTSVTLTQDPTTNLQAATKQYVDGLVATGLAYHDPVKAATTGTLASITGGTVTYNNGTAGVGATLTLSVALTTLDGYTLLNGNRILVKDEATQANNGIYTWATGGTVLTRATDADTYGPAVGQLSRNDYFFTTNGTINQGVSYVVTTVGTIIFGSTAITFAEFSSSKVYTAGTGLTLTNTQFSLTSPVAVALGGSGLTTTPGNGELDIGNGTGFTRTTLTAGSGIQITNSSGAITIATTGSLPSQTGNANRFLTTDGTTASWAFVPAVPGPVSGVTATASSTSGQIDVAWTAPNAALNVTSSVIYYSTTSPVTTASPSITVYTNSGSITGLTTTYGPVYIAVSAVNSYGAGLISAQVNATPKTVPTTPAITNATADGVTSIGVTWTASSNGNPTPTYRLYYSTSSPVTAASSYITITSSPVSLTGLSASTTYYLAVGAVNSQGITLSSQSTAATPPPGTTVYSAGQSLSISGNTSKTFLMDGSCTGMRLRCAGGAGGGGGGWNASGAAGANGGYADAQILRTAAADGVFIAYSGGGGYGGCQYAGAGWGGGASAIVGYGTGVSYVVAGGGGGGGSGWNGTAGIGGSGGVVVGSSGTTDGGNGQTTQQQGGFGGTGSAAGTNPSNSSCNGSGHLGGQGGRAGGTAGQAGNSSYGSGGSYTTDYYYAGAGGGGGYYGGAGGMGSSAGDGGGGGSSYVNPSYCTGYSYGGSQPQGGYGGSGGGGCGNTGGSGYVTITFY